jgi:hypothetical protein
MSLKKPRHNKPLGNGFRAVAVNRNVDLFAEKDSGYQQKNGLINKYRQVIPIKDGIGNTAPNDGRHSKKDQNTQLSTDAHLRLPPPSIVITPFPARQLE